MKVCPNYTWEIAFFQLNVEMEGVNSIHDLGALAWLSSVCSTKSCCLGKYCGDDNCLQRGWLEWFTGVLMILKLHFLNSHLDYFTTNLGDYIEEQEERSHKDIKETERRYQKRWNVNFNVKCCLKRGETSEKLPA